MIFYIHIPESAGKEVGVQAESADEEDYMALVLEILNRNEKNSIKF